MRTRGSLAKLAAATLGNLYNFYDVTPEEWDEWEQGYNSKVARKVSQSIGREVYLYLQDLSEDTARPVLLDYAKYVAGDRSYFISNEALKLLDKGNIRDLIKVNFWKRYN